MRQNTLDTFKAWVAGKKCKPAASIWTDGKIIYSYGTRIVWQDGGRLTFDERRYSSTTSNHQNSLRFLLEQNKFVWCPVVDN